MKPDERLIFSEGAININITEAANYSAWKEGKLVFRGAPMAEVVRRIEHWYNVDVELVDKELEKYIIRGTFQDDSLLEVFQYLNMTSPIRFQIQDRKMLADGPWQKQKILLYKK
jgi:ferric-dicitrate binding protein FerR (iron transport regulator)